MPYVVGTNPAVSHASRTSRLPGRVPPHRPAPPIRPSAAPLVEIVESAILPRLMAAHGLAVEVRDRAPAPNVRLAMDVDAIVPLALHREADALLAHVEQLLGQGASIDSLFVDLLAPAARNIGVLWEEDRCDFLEVTMGLWRLQEVVRELAARLPADYGRCGGRGRRILCAAMPGDQHSFGTVMIDETFRREGWDSEAVLDPATPELIGQVAREWFDVVGLTVSCDCHIEPLPSLIHAVRAVSKNPRIVVMVGGRVFLEDPLLAVEVGADGTAADAVQAVAVAAALVRTVAREAATCG